MDIYEGKIEGDDDILVLSNLYEDGLVRVNRWAEGLAIPQSILPYRVPCYVELVSRTLRRADEGRVM